MRFSSPHDRRPRNYLLRREQTRLLVLVAALGAVVIAMQQIGGPRGEVFFGRLFGPAANANNPPPVAPVEDNAPTASPDAIDPEQLVGVRDNTYFRSKERPAWFYLWGELQKAKPPAPDEATTYTQLVHQPHAYRGKPVCITGAVRRVEVVEATANDLGIECLYRAIVQPPGKQVWPITVYTLQPVAGVEAAEVGQTAEVRLPAECVGYFFKNQSYQWRDGMGVTPVVLARSFRVAAPEPQAEEQASEVSPLTVVAPAAVISMAAVVFLLTRGPRGRAGAKK